MLQSSGATYTKMLLFLTSFTRALSNQIVKEKGIRVNAGAIFFLRCRTLSYVKLIICCFQEQYALDPSGLLL